MDKTIEMNLRADIAKGLKDVSELAEFYLPYICSSLRINNPELRAHVLADVWGRLAKDTDFSIPKLSLCVQVAKTSIYAYTHKYIKGSNVPYSTAKACKYKSDRQCIENEDFEDTRAEPDFDDLLGILSSKLTVTEATILQALLGNCTVRELAVKINCSRSEAQNKINDLKTKLTPIIKELGYADDNFISDD